MARGSALTGDRSHGSAAPAAPEGGRPAGEPEPQTPVDLHAMLERAMDLHRRGELVDAERLYRHIVELAPEHADALRLLGLVALQQGRAELSMGLFDQAIGLRPGFAAAYSNRGYALRELMRFDEALASFDKTVALLPNFAEAHSDRGDALLDLDRFEEALASYDKALGLKPERARDHNNRGLTLYNLNRPEEALASYDEAIALKPEYAEAYSNRGNALLDLKRFDEALASYDKAIALKPDYAEAYSNRGIALHNLDQFEEALASYDEAIALKPEYAEAYSNRGNTLLALERFEEALASHDKAIALKPGWAAAYNNRANALSDLMRVEEALASYDKAIALKPDYAEAHSNRGNALRELEHFEEALASCGRAIALKPDYAEAHSNRGNALRDLMRFEEALASYARAIALKPELAEAYNNLGNLLVESKRYDEAITAYATAMAIKPDYEFVFGTWLHTRMKVCDWFDLDAAIDQLARKVDAGGKVSPPFPLLSLPTTLEQQQKAAAIWSAARFPPDASLPPIARRPRKGPLRVGYFSADFHNHPVAWLIAGLFEQHDRSKVESIAFSFGAPGKDEMLERLTAGVDRFIDVRTMSGLNIASLARSLDVDVAIDLMGFTARSRTSVFAARAAPIQVSYLGYPGTLAAEYIDYLIADRVILPIQDQAYYFEKIVYLPNSYQVNDARRVISERVFDRSDCGLPPEGMVYCCFNSNYKISPATFASWMTILRNVDDSVLWLSADNPRAASNLRREAAARGVSPERLVFAERVPLMADHLARHRLADLFLDTAPYNAHTTASDALWAGLPVLTRAGETFAGRVAASLLNAIGMPELIAASDEAYEALAIDLGRRPEKLARLKRKLARNRLTTPLFDTERFARDIEAAYAAMDDRYRAGLAPDHINVS